MHHGIMNMKWGQRRFQNPDGSLTPLGRKRYAKLQRRKDNLDYRIKMAEIKQQLRTEKQKERAEKASQRLAAKDDRAKLRKAANEIREKELAERAELKAERMLAKAAQKELNRARKADKLIRSGNYKKIKKNSKIFTDEELNRAYNRIQSERNGRKKANPISLSNMLSALTGSTKDLAESSKNIGTLGNNLSTIYDIYYQKIRPRANSIGGPGTINLPKYYSRYMQQINKTQNTNPSDGGGKKKKK